MARSFVFATRAQALASALLIALSALLLTPAAGAAERTYRDDLAASQEALAKGDVRLAEIDARNAVKEFPSNPDVHLMLAEVLLRIGQSPEAEEEARLARWHRGNDEEIDPILAQAMLQQNKLADLIQQILPAGRNARAEASVRLSLAIAHLSLGETDIGERLLRDAKRLDPDSPKSDLALARLQMVKGDLAGAEHALQVIRAREPDSIDALRLEAEVERVKGDIDGAIATYGQALARYPDDLGLLVGRATILVSLNRVDEAQKDVDAALAIAPYSLTPNFLKGVLQARRGDLHGADDTLTGVSAMFDAVPNGYYVLGTVKYLLGQYDQAISNLAHYIGRQPDNVVARRMLAASALHLDDPGRAIAALRPVADEHPEDQESIALLARAYLAAGQKDDVVALYQWAAEGKRNTPKHATDAAVMQLGLGNATAGTAALEKVAATDGGLAIAGPILVLDDLNSGHLDEAAATAERLVAHDPKDLTAEHLLGTVRLAQLNYADAERLFSDVVARDPNFLLARRSLADTYGASGQLDKAREVNEALLKLHPKDATAMVAIAELAFRAGNPGEAKDWLIKARAADPKNLAIATRLVHFYAGQKDWDQAIASAQDLLKQDVDNPELVELVAWAQASSGDAGGAAQVYLSFFDRITPTVPLYRRLAYYQRLDGDAVGAKKTLVAALAVLPDDEGAISDLVDLAYATGGADAALDAAHTYEQRGPELTDVLAATALARANRRDEAIALLKEEQRWHPSIRGTDLFAELTYASGKRNEAEATLIELLKKNDAVAPRLALAGMYMSDQAYDKAQAQYEAVLAAAPVEPVALNNLAWLYARRGDKRARDLAIAAYRRSPTPQTTDTLGWALESVGDHATALPFLEQAAASLPEDLEVQYHLAAALQASGATARAKTLLQQIVGSKEPFSDRDDATRRLQALSRG